jgi:hypothetical protein
MSGQPSEAPEVDVPSSVDAESQSAEVVKEPAAPEQPASPLDAVKAALDEDAAVKKQSEQQPEPTERVGGEESKDSSDDADGMKGFSSKARENFAKLSAERDAYRDKASRLDALSNYAKQNSLSAEDVDQGFEVMALIKSNPLEALKRLEPVVQQLKSIVGEVLPNDIQSMVDNGSMSEDAARQLAQTRYQANHAVVERQRLEQSIQMRQQYEAQQVREATVQQTGSALTSWENSWKASDPDYSVKQPLVKAKVIELIQERGSPANADQAVALANDAKAAIEEQLSSFTRRGYQPVRTVTGGQTNNATRPTPKSPLDAVRLALGGQG